MSLPSYTGSALKGELNVFNGYLSLLYFWLCMIYEASNLFFKTLGGIITVHFSFLFFSFRSNHFKKTPWGRHHLKNGRRGLIFVLLLIFFDIFLSDFYLSFYFLLITDYGLIMSKSFTDKIKTSSLNTVRAPLQLALDLKPL